MDKEIQSFQFIFTGQQYFILCCCHFNISHYLTVKEQVRQSLSVTAMTAKFISSELSCKGYRDRAFKTIQSLHRN